MLSKLFFLLGSLWILGTLLYIALFEIGTVWLSMAFSAVMTNIGASFILLLGGGILLDLADKDEARKRNKP